MSRKQRAVSNASVACEVEVLIISALYGVWVVKIDKKCLLSGWWPRASRSDWQGTLPALQQRWGPGGCDIC